MNAKDKDRLSKLARGQALPRDEFLALLRDPEAHQEIRKLALVRSLFEAEMEPQPEVSVLPDAGLAGAGLTALWWQGDVEIFQEKLRPWLRQYILDVGLPEADVASVLEFVMGCMSELGPQERVSAALPGWIQEYAAGRHTPVMSVPLDRAWVLSATFRAMLQEQPEQEDDTREQVRQRAVELAVKNPQDLRSEAFLVQFGRRRYVESYCLNLAAEWEQRAEQAAEVLLN